MEEKLSPRQAAAVWWSSKIGAPVKETEVQQVTPEAGQCSERLDPPGVCLRAKDHAGPHRGEIHMDDAGLKWEILED